MPGSRVAPSTSSAYPSPPAAPAPWLERRAGGPALRRTAPASRRRPAAAPRGCPSADRRPWWRRTARSAGCPRRWRRPAGRPEPLAGSGDVDRVTPSSPAPPRVQRYVGGGAERGQQPGPAVVGAAAAEPDHHGRSAGVDRCGEELSDAVRRGRLGPPGRRRRSGAGRRPARSRRTPSAPTSRTVAGVGAPCGPRTVTERSVAAECLVQHVDEARDRRRTSGRGRARRRGRSGASRRRSPPPPRPR